VGSAQARRHEHLGTVAQQPFLLAVDGSDHSRKATALAVEAAGQSQGEVVVVHVREHVVDRGGVW
jgi:nucleotide-binding universal stress UspA family protein